MVLGLIGCCSTAHASGACNELEPANDFVCNVKVRYVTCSMKVQLALLKNQSVNDTYACIEEDKAAVEPLYQSTKIALQGNASAIAELKSMYVFWLASMDKLIADPNTSKFIYKATIEARRDELNSAGYRLKLEAE